MINKVDKFQNKKNLWSFSVDDGLHFENLVGFSPGLGEHNDFDISILGGENHLVVDSGHNLLGDWDQVAELSVVLGSVGIPSGCLGSCENSIILLHFRECLGLNFRVSSEERLT